MSEDSKQKVARSISFDPDTLALLDRVCADTGMNRSAVVNLLVNSALKSQTVQDAFGVLSQLKSIAPESVLEAEGVGSWFGGEA